jgi:hypothetical protein
MTIVIPLAIVSSLLANTRALSQVSCGPEMAVCAAEGAFCTTPDNVAGTCTTTFLTPPNQSPFCNCLPPSGGGSGYRSTSNGTAQLGASGNIQPGAQLHFVGTLPAQMALTKGANSQNVSLSSADLNISISPVIDGAGRSTFAVSNGSGAFAPYVFGGDPIGSSSFVVERGDGWIRWSDGRCWASFRILVSTAGFPNIRAVAYGPGTVNFTSDVVTIDPTALSIEITSVPAIPALAPLALVVLMAALMSAGVIVIRRCVA